MCVYICDDYFHFFSSRLSECACICVVSWKERCRIIALFNPFSMCDEIKYVLNQLKTYQCFAVHV